MPKVSIIIPVYGVEKYIERCARSLFEQTLDSIEYLFIDDCTPDKSIEILKRVLEDYPQRKSQVVIHRMKQNSGQAKVREWGMLNASGKYIIHCDSDDWVDVNMYKEMYNKAIEEDVDIVICDIWISDGKNKLAGRKGAHTINKNEFIEGCLFQRDPWSLCNKLFRKKDFNKEIKFPKGALGEDMVMCLQLLIKANKLTYVPKAFYYYYVNTNSITKKKTISHCARNYKLLKDNTDLVIKVINAENIHLTYFSLVDVERFLKFSNLLSLLPIRHIPKYKKIWKQEFQFFPLAILRNPYISSYIKKLYFASLLPFYPLKSGRAEE